MAPAPLGKSERHRQGPDAHLGQGGHEVPERRRSRSPSSSPTRGRMVEFAKQVADLPVVARGLRGPVLLGDAVGRSRTAPGRSPRASSRPTRTSSRPSPRRPTSTRSSSRRSSRRCSTSVPAQQALTTPSPKANALDQVAQSCRPQSTDAARSPRPGGGPRHHPSQDPDDDATASAPPPTCSSSPALVLLAIFVVYPIVAVVYYSFTDYDIVRPPGPGRPRELPAAARRRRPSGWR